MQQRRFQSEIYTIIFISDDASLYHDDDDDDETLQFIQMLKKLLQP